MAAGQKLLSWMQGHYFNWLLHGADIAAEAVFITPHLQAQ